MAIAVIASGHIDPVNNPNIDPAIDLAGDPVPCADQQLYGYADDSGDPGAVWTYSWAILSKPTGSTASLATPTAQDTLLQNIDTWGNYRMMLVATNTNTPETSEVDPLLAPTVAFVTVRLRSANAAIQKPAAGERNWNDDVYEWADAIETMGTGAHDIISHTDVVNATGPDLDVLVSQGLADDPNAPGTSLHTHQGTDVPVATTTTQGTVTLEDAPVDPLVPKVVTRERLIYTAESTSTLLTDTTLANVSVGAYPAALGALHEPPCLLFRIREDVTIVHWTAAFTNCGGINPGTGLPETYKVDLFQGSLADVQAGTMTTMNITVSATQILPGYVSISGESVSSIPVLASQYIGVVVTAAPNIPGSMMTVTIDAERRI